MGLGGLGLVACGPGDDGGAECSGLVLGDLVITEVLADYGAPDGASGTDEGKEWFEIHNATGEPIELEGVVLEHGRPDALPQDRKRHVMRPVTIPANGYLALGNVLPDLAPDHVDYGYANALGDLYNSGGGRLALMCGTTLVDEATYDGVEVGQTFALDGGSPPDGQANDVLANWCTTDETAALEYEPANYGTPGAANPDCMVVLPGQCDDSGTMRATVPPQVGDLTITEVMPSPSAVSDTVGEWFEVLVNRDVDLNGLGLDRVDDSSSPVVLQSSACLRATAGTYLVFAKSDVSGTNGGIDGVDGTFGFSLVPGTAADPADVRILIDTTELDLMTWTSARNGRSIQLDMGLSAPTDNDLSTNLCDGTTAYGAGDLGTPGQPNLDCGVDTTGMCLDTGTQTLRPIVKPTAGQLVIDEWYPDPVIVTDAVGEWFELRATADVDLNGLQGGGATLGATPLIPAGGDCVRLTTGSLAVFARTTGAGNGLPASVTPAATFPFGLGANDAGSFQIGIDGTNLATATWTMNASTTSAGSSWQVDSDGTQCTGVAAGAPAYNSATGPTRTDSGTPAAMNPECP
ncbi:MAG: lamin tail domain-containing protein [Kofleriaceae bacterium]|nr:MAG: lamin tail domain-containing protein [Kofleriaceae bacterium]MBZ0238621.1 lamin tail domain-containing protein [Kofleriaceae bacterium]